MEVINREACAKKRSHTRMHLLIVREKGSTWLDFYTALEGNHHFLAIPKKSPNETFLSGETP